MTSIGGVICNKTNAAEQAAAALQSGGGFGDVDIVFTNAWRHRRAGLAMAGAAPYLRQLS